jgi:hypothetical protein
MSDLFGDAEVSQEMIIATIGNQNNPTQVVEIVHLPDKELFLTRGISTHFNLKEIAVPQDLMLPALQEITGVVSYLLERIATADDFKLPFRYEPEFEVGDSKFTLQEGEDFMMLKREE